MKFAVITLFLLITIGTVAAENTTDIKYYSYRVERVTEFDYVTGQDYSIVSVYLNDIGFNSTQTVLLDAYGEIYTLTITATAEGTFGAYKNFTVTLTYPNGSTVTWNYKTFDLAGQDYDVKIQYWVQQADSWLDLDIYIGGLLDFQVLPFGTKFNLTKFVLFNRVQGTSTKEMNVDIFYVATEDWAEIVEKGESPFDWGGLTDAIKDTPGNIWNQFLGLVEQIPVAGEYLADGLNFMAILVGETFFYVKLIFVENWEIAVLTFEAFAMMYAIAGGNQEEEPSFVGMLRRYWSFHATAIMLIFYIIRDTLNLIWRLISAVGSLLPFT